MGEGSKRPAANAQGSVLQLKLTLRGVSKPPVWQRLDVEADTRLDRLHDVIQTSMGWEHDIVLEKRLDPGPEVHLPACTGGKGACPPEDCGGPCGYADVKATIADPGHEAHDHMLDWLGLECAEEFDPAAFDLAEINEVLNMTTGARR